MAGSGNCQIGQIRSMIETFALCLFLVALPIEQVSAYGVTILKFTGGLAFAVWLLSHLGPHERIRWDPGLTLMTLFIVWAAASAFWSIDSARSMQKISTYVLLLVSYFLIVNVIRSEKQLSAAMVALWLGALVLLSSGAVDMASAQMKGPDYRLRGILSNPNEYAAMLVACVPSGYWFYTRTRVPLRGLVVLAAAGVALITITYSGSRGGAISVILFLLSLLAFRQTRPRAVGVTILLLAVGIRMAPVTFWQRWEESREQGGDVRTLELWPAGMRAVAERPLLGSGLGTNAQAIALARGRAQSNVVHNPPLAIAVELGLPGLALYLGFIGYVTIRFLRALVARTGQGRSKQTGFAIVLFASYVGYMASWFKQGGAEYFKILWVLLGLMSVCARMLEQPSGATGRLPSPKPTLKPMRYRTKLETRSTNDD